MSKRVPSIVAAVVLIAGCAPAQPSPGLRNVSSLTPTEAAGILALVNDCVIDLSSLDVDAALDARAARGIIAHRDGLDGVCGTSDDDRFDSIEELDAVAYVGDSAIQKLLAFASARGYLEGGSAGEIVGYFDGVAFTAAEIDGVLAIVNGASLAVLDDDVGLDARAANGIVAARPFSSSDRNANMEALAAVPYVGASALESLKAYIPSWQPQGGTCPAVGGTFEGVTFSDRQASDVLDLANRGDSAALEAVSGIGPTLSARLIAARPFAGVDAVGAVSGVGATVLTNLRDQVETTWCSSATAACGCSGASSGGGGTASETHDGVTFSAAEVTAALAILNQASEAQLRADGGFSGPATAIILGGRPWASLAAFAGTSGIGTSTMEQLQAYASNGLWLGPGPMRTAITVAQVVADPGRYLGQFVSFNEVVAKTANGPMRSLAEVGDGAGSASWLRLIKYLCDPISGSCQLPPAIDSGDRLTLIHVRVDSDYDGFYLRMVDTTLYQVHGCAQGWVKSCGFDRGVCKPGTQTCSSNTWSECTGFVERLDTDPPDGLDNDCDGLIDENATSLDEEGHLPGTFIGFAPNGAGSIAATPTEYLRIDARDPTRLAIVERSPRPEGAAGLVTVKTTAGGTLLSDCRVGVSIYPLDGVGLEPTLTLPAEGTACLRDADLSGTRLIVTDWYTGVSSYDISGSSPVRQFRTPTRFPRRGRLRNGHLIAMGNAFEIYVLNGDTTALVQSFPISDYPGDMALSDAGLAVVTTSGGMMLFDVSDPAAATQLPTFAFSAGQMSFSGTRMAAISTGGDRLLTIVDFAEPAQPKICAQATVSTYGGETTTLDGVSFRGEWVYVWSESGLHSFRVGATCGP